MYWVVYSVAWDSEDLSRGAAEKLLTKLPSLGIHLQDTSHCLTRLPPPLLLEGTAEPTLVDGGGELRLRRLGTWSWHPSGR